VQAWIDDFEADVIFEADFQGLVFSVVSQLDT